MGWSGRGSPGCETHVMGTVTNAVPDGALPREAALLDWFSRRRRELPWRQTRDPWAVLISELMLQQTQVARVKPRYDAFLARWPTPQACAAAPLGDIVAAWSGLGYNRRAVALHRCAQVLTTDHGGRLPDDLVSLLTLPGVGPYTARAVLAFAYERDDVGVLDTNAARVLARWGGRTLGRLEAQSTADGAVPDGRGWAWNQAMLDLGATVCRARCPECPDCPVSGWCAWRRAGNPRPDPALGSAGVSGPQSRFEGSDRQGRGRLVDALRHGPVPASALAEVMGWPDDPVRAERLAASLVTDGLAVVDTDGTFRLPA